MSPSFGMAANLGLSGFNKFYSMLKASPPTGEVAHLRVDNRKLTPDDKFINIDTSKYDYRLIGVHRYNGASQELFLGVNSDNSNNYYDTYMFANGVVDSSYSNSDRMRLSVVDSGGDTYDGFFEYYIDGETGKPTFFNGNAHLRDASNNASIIQSAYWDDTNPVTEINLLPDINDGNYDIDLWLFIKEKLNAFDGYYFDSKVELTGTETEIEFPNLQGDIEKDYIIAISNLSNNALFDPMLIFNNDSGANYVNNIFIADDVNYEGKTIDPDNGIRIIETEAEKGLTHYMRIHARSGGERSTVAISGNNNPTMQETVGWWKNTVDEITNIKITIPTGTTGTVYLYKQSNNDPCLVDEIEVDGVFDEGHTFNVPSGDDILYEFTACLYNTEGGASSGKIIINGDIDSNYRYIRMRSLDNVLSSGKGNTARLFAAQCNNGTIGQTKLVMYSKKGRYKPVISKLGYYSGGYYFENYGQAWKNDVDDIRTIKYFQDSTKPVKGYVRLRAIQLPTADIQPVI